MTWTLVAQIAVLIFFVTVCVSFVLEKWPRKDVHNHFYGGPEK